MTDFSVLLSVYYKEKPEFLQSSINSVYNQTRKPSEVILVKDGPLTIELEKTIDNLCSVFSDLIIVPLEKNSGLGIALNEGLKHCSFDIVARMDTDDVAKQDRFEKEISVLEKYPEIDIVGAWVDEFIEIPSNVVSTRKVPEKHEEILKYSKYRAPVNHPSVMFRKKAVLDAGSYLDLKLYEDYYLWARMLMNGAVFYNIQESLLYFRITDETYKRRGGIKYASVELNFLRKMYKIHFLSFSEYLINIIVHTSVRLVPNNLRAFLYKHILRN